MKRYFVVLAILLAGPAFARSATFSLFGKAADGVGVAVQHDVKSYTGFLGSEVSRFASVGLVSTLAAGGMHADAAPSPGGNKSLEELQRDYRNLQEERDSYGGVPGLGLLIAGGVMMIGGFIVMGVVPSIFTGLALAAGLGGAGAIFGIISTIVLIVGIVIAVIGAILVTVGVIKLIVGLSNKRRLTNEMEEVEKQINMLKGGAPAAPAARFGLPEAAMTVATF